MEERQPPHNADAERALLGAILVDNDVMFEVAGSLIKSDFYATEHGELFILCADIINAGRVATPSSVLSDFSQNTNIGYGVKTDEWLRGLVADAAPTKLIAKTFAHVIADNAKKRKQLRLHNDAIDRIYSAGASITADTLRDQFDADFSSSFASLTDLGIRHIAEWGDEVLEEAKNAGQSDLDVGLPIGLKGIQDLNGSLVPGRLYSWAGASGSGKSALAQQVLSHITRPETGKVGLWVQAEMQGGEIAARGMAALTGIPGESIELGKLNDREFVEAFEANEAMRLGRLFVDAGTLPPVAKIKARAQRMKKMRGLDVIVVDHLMYLGKPDQRMDDIAAIPHNMRELKAMAKELQVPVIVLMALKSAYHDGDLRRPRMSDLTHPAAIDSNSDVILFLHRPEYILRRNPVDETDKGYADWTAKLLMWEGRAEALLNKRRGGEGAGLRPLGFDKKRVKFFDNVKSIVPVTPPHELPFSMQNLD